MHYNLLRCISLYLVVKKRGKMGEGEEGCDGPEAGSKAAVGAPRREKAGARSNFLFCFQTKSVTITSERNTSFPEVFS